MQHMCSGPTSRSVCLQRLPDLESGEKVSWIAVQIEDTRDSDVLYSQATTVMASFPRALDLTSEFSDGGSGEDAGMEDDPIGCR
eukprot:m.101629 g.101629  ORF g.101629 m.101629 type:complete len:84 (+) comp14982_c0_seq9:1396-1647(+)